MTRPLRFSVVVSPLAPEDGGGFLATVPDLPGCMSDGETPQQAISNVQDAIESWIEAAHETGRPIPQPSRHLNAG
ncbi:type II toxin-antitoxin system HicB family antitoxin [Pseudorhizobium endolithicum]|uniref:type II toxin-antitoxin system HicB family antitoxin n=1 Tax=Pseudorhizobium endolithicum TaxID=1191678 RepID=UPI0011572B4E|nr:type II toxin-antitoxin system HicB family antitoxin [Pseudorhizobium endolithicum]CAD6421603.1 type II toxin-antitoxin system HicB family antitoxin [Rhizobium sp. Q54]